jgi:hypothetical protein
MIWSKRDIAEALGLSVRRVNQLQKDGVIPDPVVTDAKVVIKSYVSFIKTANKDLLTERTRLTKINADRKQLQLEKERGELIETKKAMWLWGGVCQAIHSKILYMPSKLAPLILGAKTIPEIKSIVEKFTREILTEIANPDLEEVASLSGNDKNTVNKRRLRT